MPAPGTAIRPERRREIVDALRRGTVPQRGLDVFAVGLDHFDPGLDAELEAVARGGAGFKAIRGEYGSGKTLFARRLQERAQRRRFATESAWRDFLVALLSDPRYDIAGARHERSERGSGSEWRSWKFVRGHQSGFATSADGPTRGSSPAAPS